MNQPTNWRVPYEVFLQACKDFDYQRIHCCFENRTIPSSIRTIMDIYGTENYLVAEVVVKHMAFEYIASGKLK